MIDKYAALRVAAEKAQLESKDEWGYDTDAFHDEATPETILELLAERDADRARIAELGESLEKASRANAAQDDHINQQQDRIDELEKGHQEAARQINAWHRLARQSISEREKDLSELDSARQRITELEARTLTVKMPQGYVIRAGHPINEGERHVMVPKDGGDWLSSFDVELALLRAGISLKIEGE